MRKYDIKYKHFLNKNNRIEKLFSFYDLLKVLYAHYKYNTRHIYISFAYPAITTPTYALIRNCIAHLDFASPQLVNRILCIYLILNGLNKSTNFIRISSFNYYT